MDVIEVEPAQARVTLRADRRAAVWVAALSCVYGALLLYLRFVVAMPFSLKEYVILGASFVFPVIVLAEAARRTFRLERDVLFVSGPLGIGGRTYDVRNANLVLSDVHVAGQPSHRLAWELEPNRTLVMCTWVVNRFPLIDALRAAMSAPASAAALENLAVLSNAARAAQRAEVRRFAAIACLSIAASAAWIFWHLPQS